MGIKHKKKGSEEGSFIVLLDLESAIVLTKLSKKFFN